jgi:hypothetical protein
MTVSFLGKRLSDASVQLSLASLLAALGIILVENFILGPKYDFDDRVFIAIIYGWLTLFVGLAIFFVKKRSLLMMFSVIPLLLTNVVFVFLSYLNHVLPCLLMLAALAQSREEKARKPL